MIPDDTLTIRDLSGDEIALLLRYRLMTDEEKLQAYAAMEQLADRESLNTDRSSMNTN